MNNGNQKIGSISHQREKLLVKEEAQELQNTEEIFDKEEEQLQEETQVEGIAASQEELNSNETVVPIEATIFANVQDIAVVSSVPHSGSTVIGTAIPCSTVPLNNLPNAGELFFSKNNKPYKFCINTELEDFVKYAAGPFYAAYLNAGRIKTEHLRNSGDIIREEAAREIVKFGKILLAVLKEEQA